MTEADEGDDEEDDTEASTLLFFKETAGAGDAVLMASAVDDGVVET